MQETAIYYLFVGKIRLPAKVRPVRQSAGQGVAKFFTFLLFLYSTWATSNGLNFPPPRK